MKDLRLMNNPHGDDKVIDACSIFGAIDVSGHRFSCEGVVRAMANMHDRSNGLGGGFALYGLYPDFPDEYAFHIMYLNRQSRIITEAYLNEKLKMVYSEEISVRNAKGISNPPLLYRYFLDVKEYPPEDQSEDDYVVDRLCFQAERIWGYSKEPVSPRISPSIFASKNITATSGPLTVDFQPIHMGGGEELIPSAYSTGRLFIMERYLLTELIAATWSSMVITAPCRPIPR